MGMVQFTLTENTQLSEESLKRQEALKDRPIDYSDIPEYSIEELMLGKRIAAEMRKKQMFSLNY